MKFNIGNEVVFDEEGLKGTGIIVRDLPSSNNYDYILDVIFCNDEEAPYPSMGVEYCWKVRHKNIKHNVTPKGNKII